MLNTPLGMITLIIRQRSRWPCNNVHWRWRQLTFGLCFVASRFSACDCARNQLNPVYHKLRRLTLIKAPSYKRHLSHAERVYVPRLSVCLSVRCHRWLADQQLMETGMSRCYRTGQRQTSILSKTNRLLLLLPLLLLLLLLPLLLRRQCQFGVPSRRYETPHTQ